jgi:autotransporter-associated beta strand protein
MIVVLKSLAGAAAIAVTAVPAMSQQLADYYFTSASASSPAQVRTTSGTSNLQNGSGSRAFNPLTNTTGVWSSSLATKSLLIGPVSVGGSGTAGFVSFGSTGGANNPTFAGLIFGAAQTGGYTVIAGGTSAAATNSVTLGGGGSVGIATGTGLVIRSDATGATTFQATNAAGAALRVTLGSNQTWTNDNSTFGLFVNTPVTGAFSLTTNGVGATTLSGSNTFGNLTVGGGTLTLSNPQASGTGSLTIAAGALMNLRAALSKDIANSGTIAIGAGGSLTAASLGSGVLGLAGVSGTGATFTSSGIGTLGIGALTLDGDTTIAMAAGSDILSSGAVAISGGNNLLSLSGVFSLGTTTLVSGASLTNTGLISLTGAAVGNQTIALGSSGTVGRTTYTFTSTTNALQVQSTGGPFDLTWNGGASGTWNTVNADWQQNGTGPNIAFVTADNVAFDAPAAVAVDSGTAVTITVGNVSAANSAGDITLSGSALAIGGSLAKTAAGTLTTGNTVSVAQGVSVGGGTFVSNGPLAVSGGGVAVTGGEARLNAAAAITGNLTVTGGTAALNAANTISGTVLAQGGSLVVAHNTALGTAGVTLDGGRLLAVSSATSVTNAITVAAGGGTLDAGATVFTGNLAVVAGTLGLNGSATVGKLSGGVGGVVTNASTSGTAVLTTVFASSGTSTYAGTITDNGGGIVALVKTGTTTGDLVLTASNSFSGGTRLDSDIFIQQASGLGTGPIASIGPDARVYWDGVDASVTIANDLVTGTSLANALAFAPGASRTVVPTGAISGAGQIKVSGNATATLDLRQQTALTNTNQGGVEIGTGRVLIADGANLGGGNVNFGTGANSYLVVGGSSVTVSNPFTIGSTANTGAGTANFDTAGNSLIVLAGIADRPGNLPGSVVKLGAGDLILTGTSTYTGATTVSAGTLLVMGELYAGTATALTTTGSGAAIGGDGVLRGSLALASGANFVFDPAATLTVSGSSVTFGGFGIPNLLGLSQSTPEGTYVLIDGTATIDPTNLANVGSANAYDLGGGKSAFFGIGSLTVTVVPEPSTMMVLATTILILPLAMQRLRRGLGRQ